MATGIAAGLMLATGLMTAAVPLPARAASEPAAVVATYADVAQAMFEDAHAAAKDLQAAVDALLAKPNAETLAAARAAWIAARPWYSQTEALRFGNKAVDDWEGKVNAWPLDEGLIDYVDAKAYGEESDENPLYRANVVANPTLKVGRKTVNAKRITKALIADTLHEAGGVEANVASGYHAVEFLLWGQDLNGTGPGAGARPASDYDLKACSNGHCDRRRAYLKAVTDLLVDDLADMAGQWKPTGAARKALAKKGADGGLATILTGIGSLSYGELAGERMKLGVLLHDPEEEQDCFSDQTHIEPAANQKGMVALLTGRYERRGGGTVAGASLAALAAEKAPDEAARVDVAFAETTAKLEAIRTAGAAGTAWDQMIGPGNATGNALILDGVAALVAQTRAVEALVGKLGLTISLEGSDSLDAPDKVKTP
jgi:putative iron-regulated protein